MQFLFLTLSTLRSCLLGFISVFAIVLWCTYRLYSGSIAFFVDFAVRVPRRKSIEELIAGLYPKLMSFQIHFSFHTSYYNISLSGIFKPYLTISQCQYSITHKKSFPWSDGPHQGFYCYQHFSFLLCNTTYIFKPLCVGCVCTRYFAVLEYLTGKQYILHSQQFLVSNYWPHLVEIDKSNGIIVLFF